MAKKSTAIVAKLESETATEPEPPTDTAMDRPDPTVLGVSVPLALTFRAVKQVVDAWAECLRELSVAVKTKGAKAVTASETSAESPIIHA